jgi:CHAT domain-containing protein/Flp pilus assembly protein TadD
MAKLPRCLAILAVAVVLGIPAPAAAQRDSGAALFAQITELFKAGKYADAVSLAQRLVSIAERTAGPNHPNVGTALSLLANIYEAQGRYTDAEPPCKRALAIYEKANGPEHPTVALALGNLANLYEHEGRYGDAEPLYQRSIAIYEKTYGPDHIEVGHALANLSSLYEDEARYGEAESLSKRAVGIIEKALGSDNVDVATALNNLAALYKVQGRSADAEQLYKRTLAIREKALGPDHPDLAPTLYNLAGLYRSQARYADAEPLYKQALAIREKGLGPNHPDVAQSLNSLAIFYEDEERYDDAEPLFKRSVAIYEKALGPDHPNVAGPVNNLANLYRTQHRYGEAEPLNKRALAIFEKAKGPDHPDVAIALGNLAEFYRDQHRYSDAEALQQRALVIYQKVLGADHPDLARERNALADTYEAQARYGEAEPLYKQALATFETALGPDHPDTVWALNNLANLYLDQGRYADALPFAQRLIAAGKALPYVALPVLFGAQREGIVAADKALDDSLNVVQRAAQTSAATAISKLGIRLAVGSDRLGQLVRQDQDLASEAEADDKAIVAAVSKEPGKRDPATEQRLRDRLAAIATEREALRTTLAKEFPDYAALSNPQPATAKQIQGLLSGDEALLLFAAAGDKQSYIFAFTREGVDWKSIPFGADALADKVAQFRRGLDVDMVEDQSALDAANIKRELFDLSFAYELYSTLLGPVEGRIKGKRQLLVVPFGPLTALPFHLLISEKASALPSSASTGITAESMAPYRNAAWLIKRQAVSVMPSLASLVVLRQFARKAQGAKPIIGFGDPVFNPDAAAAATAKRGAKKTVSRSLITRSFTDFWHGAGVDRRQLGQALPQLPDTADELNAVAKSLGAPPQDIHLGHDASETTVKHAPLADYGIVYFATHGLVAGDIKGLGEPSLALTIPAQPNNDDDGLLTASEVAQLKLNADWVVLSACNTIAGGKPGAEALSGLARAFFYAGARSLLVSHWSVASDAATRLTIASFDLLKTDPKLGRAEALRRSMLAYLDDPSQPRNAYPAMWGPFSIIGEGAAR